MEPWKVSLITVAAVAAGVTLTLLVTPDGRSAEGKLPGLPIAEPAEAPPTSGPERAAAPRRVPPSVIPEIVPEIVSEELPADDGEGADASPPDTLDPRLEILRSLLAEDAFAAASERIEQWRKSDEPFAARAEAELESAWWAAIQSLAKSNVRETVDPGLAQLRAYRKRFGSSDRVEQTRRHFMERHEANKKAFIEAFPHPVKLLDDAGLSYQVHVDFFGQEAAVRSHRAGNSAALADLVLKAAAAVGRHTRSSGFRSTFFHVHIGDLLLRFKTRCARKAMTMTPAKALAYLQTPNCVP